MSELYSIKKETLTGIADALRARLGETETVDIVTEEIADGKKISKTPNATGFETFEGAHPKLTTGESIFDTVTISCASSIKVKLYAKTTSASYYCTFVFPGEVNALPEDIVWTSGYGGEGDYSGYREFKFKGSTVTFCFHCDAALGSCDYLGYYAEVTGYDADGNELVEGEKYAVTTPTEIPRVYTSDEMAGAIDDIPDATIGFGLFHRTVDRTITSVSQEDLNGVTVIGADAFGKCDNLTSVELPDSIQQIRDNAFYLCTKLTNFRMSQNINKLGTAVFRSTDIAELTMPHTPPVIEVSTFENANKLKTIYVPGEALDDYYVAPYWATNYRSLLVPNSKYVHFLFNTVLAFDGVKSYSLKLQNYTEAPETYSIVSSNTDVASITNIVATNSNITFDVVAGNTEGEATISVSVLGDNNHMFVRECKATVVAELVESTYEVVPVEGAQYGFVLGEDGYWTSTNNKVNASYSLCQVNISNMIGRVVCFECINFAEANYDYGVFSNVNTTLTKTVDDSTNVYKSFKGQSKADVQTLEYTDATGDCFIQIKYRKDASGDQNNDSLKFKVKFID